MKTEVTNLIEIGSNNEFTHKQADIYSYEIVGKSISEGNIFLGVAASCGCTSTLVEVQNTVEGSDVEYLAYKAGTPIIPGQGFRVSGSLSRTGDGSRETGTYTKAVTFTATNASKEDQKIKAIFKIHVV